MRVRVNWVPRLASPAGALAVAVMLGAPSSAEQWDGEIIVEDQLV